MTQADADPIIRRMAAEGATKMAVAGALGVTRQTLDRWLGSLSPAVKWKITPKRGNNAHNRGQAPKRRKRPPAAVAITRKPDALPTPKPDAVDVSTLPEARTADELQALLASIIAGKVICSKLQFDAISKQLDTARKDGAAADTEEQAWVSDSAAFERRVAEAQHLEQHGEGS